MYGKTNGKVNVALGSVLSIWHNCRTAGLDEPKDAVLPDIRALSEASKHTDINSIIIDAEASTVYISDPMTTLDVGAVAKGYAVEMVARSLEERGISGYVINVGGNVRTIGTKPDGEKWLTGIENPDTDSDMPYRKYLELSGEAIVTSGSYQMYYTVDGKNYHHIIDPDTLFPAEGYLSVSVVSDSSALGDALSTALFCMPHEDGLALVKALENTEAMWVLSDGTEIMSGGFSRFVSNR
jgi:thiamine biosynthesis lipoprotein